MRRPLLVASLISLALNGETLSPRTLAEFDSYMSSAQEQMAKNGALWVEQHQPEAAAVRQGRVASGYYTGSKPKSVYDGLIHDWAGALFLPGAKLELVLAVLRDYDRHASIYAPEVIASRKLGGTGGVDQTKVRFRKKKLITVILEADFEVRTERVSPTRVRMDLRSSRIAEVQDAGAPGERVLAPDTGYGFLWRLNSWYVLSEADGGVYVELRAISLTRDIPFGLGAIIGPMVHSLPRESLLATLERTRAAVQALR